MGFRFEGLKIWQRSRVFIGAVTSLTGKFPRKENFALTSQINRAVYSIGLTIAEGSGRNSSKEFSHYLDIAIGSLFEVVSGLIFALDQKYITQEEFDSMYFESEILGKSINRFKQSIE